LGSYCPPSEKPQLLILYAIPVSPLFLLAEIDRFLVDFFLPKPRAPPASLKI
jgi:hypothetical protein